MDNDGDGHIDNSFKSYLTCFPCPCSIDPAGKQLNENGENLSSQYYQEHQNTIYTVVTMICIIFFLPGCFAAPASFDSAGELAP